MNQVIDLSGDWEFRQAGTGARRVKSWLPAVVPGTVHTDLLTQELIPDPFHRMNELDQRWVEQADWLYRRSFQVGPEFLRNARAVWLEFDGLDTFATVRLNGGELGRTDNMFHPWRFDVKPLLKAGANTLEVEFASAPRIAEALAARTKVTYRSFFYLQRQFIRKAQYSGGWDWGPRLLTCGIWRPVRLRSAQQAEIRNLRAVTSALSPQKAALSVEVEIDSYMSGRAKLAVQVVAPDGAAGAERAVEADITRGTQILSLSLALDRPALWWPNGLGAQPLYQVRATLSIGGETVDAADETIGLRTVELVREKDNQGESFRFRVNGRDVFCKGANWVPADSFLPRVTPEQYRARLADARDAHMNMIRVWGGGVYEDAAFYRACDELGLMVWQDFMFACAEYPESPELIESVRREARHVVRRLRNHPSLVIWCGNNENHWFFDELWAPVQKKHGEVFYHEVLPSVCREHDPQRPYWPGSPYGGPKANDPNFGDQHVWSVWGWWANPEKYRECPARFASEFGFQAMPPAKTVEAFTQREDRWLFSPVIDHHNKAEDGHPRIMKFLTGSLGPPAGLDDYIYLSQVQQAEAMKIAVEHWRRRWPASAGALYWQLNDCWPVASWSAVDYYGRPKALWYASRRFFAPVLVSLRPVSAEPSGPTDLEVWVSHDLNAELSVCVEASAWTLEGKPLKKRAIDAALPANSSRRIAVLEYAALGLADPATGFVHVRLCRGREALAENFHFFAPARHIDWPDPGLRVKAATADGGILVEVTARRPARAVCLTADRFEGRFSDNFFDLLPGERRPVRWLTQGRAPAARAFQSALETRYMKPQRL